MEEPGTYFLFARKFHTLRQTKRKNAVRKMAKKFLPESATMKTFLRFSGKKEQKILLQPTLRNKNRVYEHREVLHEVLCPCDGSKKLLPPGSLIVESP